MHTFLSFFVTPSISARESQWIWLLLAIAILGCELQSPPSPGDHSKGWLAAGLHNNGEDPRVGLDLVSVML